MGHATTSTPRPGKCLAGRSAAGTRISSCLHILLIIALVFAAGRAPAAEGRRAVSPELREKAVSTLREGLREGERWVQVHAAEALLALDHPAGVRDALEAEAERHGNEPEYRVGVWRVLARAGRDAQTRDAYVARIREAFEDADGPDRLHAVETLAKLGVAPDAELAEALDAVTRPSPTPMGQYAFWALSRTERAPEALRALAEGVRSEWPLLARVSAYVLRHLGGELDEEHRRAVQEQADKMLADRDAPTTLSEELARAYIVSAAYVLAEEPDRAQSLKTALIEMARDGSRWTRYEVASVLAERGDDADLPFLEELLQDGELDVRIAAAHAILRVDRRGVHRLRLLDWVVIVAYVFAVLCVGCYYGKRTRTREDYLLGGRGMRPLNVGLSLFASLLSTLTYLALPGEMILHGPMIFSQYLAFPLVGAVVGWLVIPRIMRLRVTTAYEILEMRLGVSVRVTGSAFFLCLRVFWMSVIIYATSSKVLVPVLGLPPAATPLLCAVLGLVTLLYTTMGGLRAVVLTDVVQTSILFVGGLLTLTTITIALGGVGAWWPTEWHADWDPPKILYDPALRLTVMGAMISAFTWWVCTTGSDQVAIQRYLATRDARTARRVLFTSLTADMCVGTFLGITGLALLAYFRARPEMLADAARIATEPDKLFPRYIVLGLPTGVSGLVVAGLFAAAMSSLSSGMNSSCSVITVDFLNRFRRRGAEKRSEEREVRTARWVSAWVGVTVVLLSSLVQYVPGNLLEVCFRVANLLVAPLFTLFFMAMFIPWARTVGTLVGAACGVAMAAGIAYGHLLGLSFIWIMPMSFATGATVGMLASLLPIGPPARRSLARMRDNEPANS